MTRALTPLHGFGRLVLPAWLFLLMVLALSASAQRSQESSSAPTGSNGFDAFRSIGDRNIFNPNRLPHVVRASGSESTGPVTEAISFVGTLQSEKGVFAFFDGTDPRHRQVLRVGGEIAGFTVKSIEAQSATFESQAGSLTLKVTDQLQRTPGSDWKVSAAPASPEGERLSGTSPLTSDERQTSSASADVSETLRRLKEKRKKQLKE